MICLFLVTTRTGQRLPQLTVHADHVTVSWSFMALATAVRNVENGTAPSAAVQAAPLSARRLETSACMVFLLSQFAETHDSVRSFIRGISLSRYRCLIGFILRLNQNQIQKEMQERSMPSLIHVRQQMTHIQLLFQCRRKEIYRSKMNRRFRRLQHQPNKRQGTKRQTHRHRGQHVFVQTHN